MTYLQSVLHRFHIHLLCQTVHLPWPTINRLDGTTWTPSLNGGPAVHRPPGLARDFGEPTTPRPYPPPQPRPTTKSGHT